MTKCPSCKTALRIVHEEGIEIDVCDSCHGVWLDPGELEAIGNTEFSPRTFRYDVLISSSCPRCDGKFSTATTEMGPIARCVGCGGVFVGGETMDYIGTHSRSEVSERSSPMEVAFMAGDLLSGIVEVLWIFLH